MAHAMDVKPAVAVTLAVIAGWYADLKHCLADRPMHTAHSLRIKCTSKTLLALTAADPARFLLAESAFGGTPTPN